MKIEIRSSFTKDADKLPANIQRHIASIIAEIQSARQINQLSNCKKLKGYKTAYRIRVGEYRIGFYYESDIVELVRALNRKDMYRYFP
jgi:mRNA interferase RelE/StbE